MLVSSAGHAVVAAPRSETATPCDASLLLGPCSHVQVPLGRVPGTPPLMLIYNKSRSYQMHVDETGGADARRLAALVRGKGIRGQKAYFPAFQDAASKELVVISGAMLPQQTW